MIAVRGAPSVDPFDRDPRPVIHGRHVAPGTELSVRGERGRVRFVELVHNPRNGLTWVAGIDRKGHARSFPCDSIVRVHRITRTRENRA